MKPWILLRIAALIAALFAAGHLLGGFQQWNPLGANPIFAQMATQRFPVDGGTRSYLDFYLGLGWSVEIFLILQTIVLWQMASLARDDATRLRPMIATFTVAAAATGLIAWRFILTIPALCALALFIVLALTFAATIREPSRG